MGNSEGWLAPPPGLEDELYGEGFSENGPCSSVNMAVSADIIRARSPRRRRCNYEELVPLQCDIIRAVESLYDDELIPHGRLVQKRLTELALAGGRTVESDLLQLRILCDACDALTIEAAGGEWRVLLHDREPNFVDVQSTSDPYPQAFWDAAHAYFESLSGDQAMLPGGRYACAQALAQRQLPFLEGVSLGKINHVVQLAIAQKKILGYVDAGIVPYSISRSMVKDNAAAQKSRCSETKGGQKLPVSSWDSARVHLHEILSDAMKTGTGRVPLSNVKRLFRSRFHLELSETALGHSKLSELLRDDQLRDICDVGLFEQGYCVIPAYMGDEQTLADDASTDYASTANSSPQSIPTPMSNPIASRPEFAVAIEV